MEYTIKVWLDGWRDIGGGYQVEGPFQSERGVEMFDKAITLSRANPLDIFCTVYADEILHIFHAGMVFIRNAEHSEVNNAKSANV